MITHFSGGADSRLALRRPRPGRPPTSRISPTAAGALSPLTEHGWRGLELHAVGHEGSWVHSARLEQGDHGGQLIGRVARPEDGHFLQHNQPGFQRHVAFEPADAADAAARRHQLQREAVGRR